MVGIECFATHCWKTNVQGQWLFFPMKCTVWEILLFDMWDVYIYSWQHQFILGGKH